MFVRVCVCVCVWVCVCAWIFSLLPFLTLQASQNVQKKAVFHFACFSTWKLQMQPYGVLGIDRRVFSLRNRWAWHHGNQPTQQCVVAMQGFRTGMRVSLCITLQGLIRNNTFDKFLSHEVLPFSLHYHTKNNCKTFWTTDFHNSQIQPGLLEGHALRFQFMICFLPSFAPCFVISSCTLQKAWVVSLAGCDVTHKGGGWGSDCCDAIRRGGGGGEEGGDMQVKMSSVKGIEGGVRATCDIIRKG